MTVSPSTRGQKGGAIRSSSAPNSLTVLVMTGDGHRREDWARYFENVGVRPIRCAGPEATTCALSLEKRCPLHEEADFIFYDEESVTPQLGSPTARAAAERADRVRPHQDWGGRTRVPSRNPDLLENAAGALSAADNQNPESSWGVL